MFVQSVYLLPSIPSPNQTHIQYLRHTYKYHPCIIRLHLTLVEDTLKNVKVAQKMSKELIASGEILQLSQLFLPVKICFLTYNGI